METKIINITPFTCAIEIVNEFCYYGNQYYQVYVNGKFAFVDNRNVFTVYNLVAGKENEIKLMFDDEVAILSIRTPVVKRIIDVRDYQAVGDGIADDTCALQTAIDHCGDQEVVVIPAGHYYTKPLFLKSNIMIYLEKDASLKGWLNRDDYPVLPGVKIVDGKEILMASWEGKNQNSFASLITGIDVENIVIFGEGTIDGQAHKSDWWVNHRQMRKAWRPNLIFLNRCKNVVVTGVTITNSPSWTMHPYYSSTIDFIDVRVINPEDAPNTDGCNPESSDNIHIIGCYFSVGDDCIALKSGKIEMVANHYKKTEQIKIRNCMMRDGHGAVVLGSEMSCGISDIEVKQCLFINTDRGLRIKTRRGRGDKAIIDKVKFTNIIMDKVLNPFVVNMFYFCDPDGKTEYVASKNKLAIDERTPYLGELSFENIVCKNTVVSAGYFYGLPEQPIAKITLKNIATDFLNSEHKGVPAMMADCMAVNRLGFYFNNVDEIHIDHVQIEGQIGEQFILHQVKKVVK